MINLPILEIDTLQNDPIPVANKLFEYFLISDYHQTHFYVSNISSLKYLIAKSENSLDLKNNIMNILTDLYNRYFNNVIINVEIKNIENSDTLKTINMEIYSDYENEKFNLNRTITVDKDIITDINEKNINLKGIHNV